MKAITPPIMSVTEALPYTDILQMVRTHMSQTQNELVNQDHLNEDNRFLFKQLMDTYIREKGLVCADLSDTALIDRLYMDMKEYSFLTPYIQPEKIQELGLEEIRVNSWECIYLITSKHGKIRLKERFLDPQHAQDVVKKLLQRSNMIIDNGTPYALGHTGKNQRIAAFQPPVLDDEIGVCANIRIVSFSKLTRDNLLKWKTATAEMLDFLEMCLRYGVSMTISGRTGSGKTGTAGYLLSTVTTDDTFRVITIEEGSREFDLVRRDEFGNVINDVIHMKTRDSIDPNAKITQDKLLELNMRNSPDIFAIGEMRSVEAYTAIEAAYTDHTVITTTHAPSARKTYKRMVMLAAKGTSSFSEDKLYEYAIEAFPIIVLQKKYPDGSRKISRIFEGTGYENGKITGNILYQYKVERTEYDENGQAIVYGRFEKGKPMSHALRERLIESGVPFQILQRFE